MIRVGLLGTGRIGSLHAENIASHRESTLDAVADIDDESANNLAVQFWRQSEYSEGRCV